MATKAAARTTGRLRAIQAALSPKEWAKVGVMAGVVLGLNVLGWAMLVAATGHHYHLSKTAVFGIGTGVLAYTLGMRHAFDADHISAIDNTTRKLMAEGKRPLSVGFFFSLGHSTIVFCLAVLLNFGIRALDSQVQVGLFGSAPVDEHRRDLGVGLLPVPHRRTQHRHPRLDPAGVPRPAQGRSSTTRSSTSSSTSGAS